MIIDNLSHFDLHFPGHRIESDDSDWAFNNRHVLYLVRDLFAEAVVAYSLFLPFTVIADNVRELIDKNTRKSFYELRLNSLSAKAFVYSLDGIGKLLFRLCRHMEPAEEIIPLCKKYEIEFGHLRHIRNSAIHIEARGFGEDRHQQHINPTTTFNA